MNPFLLGIYGIEPMQDCVRLLHETGAAGVYLLRRNVETPDQVRSLVEELQNQLGYRLLVAVEHEGGLVYRFVRGITFFPGNMALAKTGTPSLAYEVGRTMARELRAMGVNVNLAPVLDMCTEEYNPDLTIRSFGSDSTLTSDMGAEMIRGLQEGGVSAAARHFPGRGAGVAPPKQLPVIHAAKEKLMDRDVAPFKVAVAGGTELVMSANAKYPALDPENPAVFSSKIITDLLRRDMGFHGLAVTEDLTTPSALAALSPEEATVKAIQAGHDLVLLGNDVDLQRRVFKAFKLAADGGRIPKDLLSKAQTRLQEFLKKKLDLPAAGPGEADDGEASASLAEIISRAAVKIEQDPQRLIPLKVNAHAGIMVPRLADIADRVAIDDELRGGAGLVQGWVQTYNPAADVLEIPIQPEGDMLDLTLDWAGGLDVVVFLCFDAHRFPGQKRLLEEIQQRCPKPVIVLIRNPWDRVLVRSHAALVHTYGFRVPQLAAAIDVLFKGTKG